MMWVIRAGQNALYYQKYLDDRRVYLPWEGYCVNLENIDSREKFREIVIIEKKTDNRTSVSNWAGQLFSFVKEISEGDLVLIPSKCSRTYALVKIKGNYEFHRNDPDRLYRSRLMEVLNKDIPRTIFSQSIIYSLGAYRTIFKAKDEEEILKSVKEWKEAGK